MERERWGRIIRCHRLAAQSAARRLPDAPFGGGKPCGPEEPGWASVRARPRRRTPNVFWSWRDISVSRALCRGVGYWVPLRRS